MGGKEHTAPVQRLTGNTARLMLERAGGGGGGGGQFKRRGLEAPGVRGTVGLRYAKNEGIFERGRGGGGAHRQKKRRPRRRMGIKSNRFVPDSAKRNKEVRGGVWGKWELRDVSMGM